MDKNLTDEENNIIKRVDKEYKLFGEAMKRGEKPPIIGKVFSEERYEYLKGLCE